jgi:uncharacterized membrane protein YfcA
MPEIARYSLVGLIVCFTAFQEGVTGFGATALALPFVALLLGLETAVPGLCIQAWILALLIIRECRTHTVWQESDHSRCLKVPGLSLTVTCNTVWREYAHMAVLVGIGLPFGIWMRNHVDPDHLKRILAAFMVVVGAHGLVGQMMGKKHSPMSPLKRLLMSVFLPLGGVIHGAFASGGPLVVVYASRAITEKTIFRVTLCMMWFTMNTLWITQWALGKADHVHVLKIVVFLLPWTMVGLWVGNLAHYRINEIAFRKLVYGVLIASGLVLVWSLVR